MPISRFRAMLSYAMLHQENKTHDILYTTILPPLLAAACFLLVYGVRILDPLYDGWLLAGGDLSQHYIGWEGFRGSAWVFPFGLSDSLTYPTSISVIFTDSIPLLALPCKLLSPILPRTFQFWGLWGLAGFMLTALTSARLVHKYAPHPAYTVLASLFFVLSPTILQRLYGHESLGGGQWLVIASLLPLVYYGERYRKARCAAIFWGLLAFFCVGIHIYFAVICFFSLLSFCLYDLLKTRRLRTSLASGAAYCLTAIATTWLFGGLEGGITGKGAGEVGEFSANLNSLLNPLEYSRLFPALPVHGGGQYEGFAYLGIGIIVLLLATPAFLLARTLCPPSRRARERKARQAQEGGRRPDAPAAGWQLPLAFALAAAMSFLFALSPLVTAGGRLLFSVPLPRPAQKLLVTFRSTGRMIWLCFYILYFAAIVLFARLSPGSRSLRLLGDAGKTAVLAACLLLQIADFSPLIAARHRQYAARREYDNPLSHSLQLAALLEEGKGRIRHLVIASELEGEELYDLAQFAVERGMTVNRFWTVHQIGRADEQALLQQSLSQPSPDSIFLFKTEDEALGKSYGLSLAAVTDRYLVGIPGSGKTADEDTGENEK